MAPSGSHRPTLAIVSGRPGSGKTTLARQLAQAISCPLICRDEINEGIFHTFGHDLALISKDGVAKLAFDAFFRVIELLLSSSVTVVAEAAFQDHKWRVGLEPFITIADLKVVHCVVDSAVARRRVAHRHLEQRDRPGAQRAARVRPGSPLPAANRDFRPLSLSVPSLHVATGNGYEPGLDEVLGFIMPGPG